VYFGQLSTFSLFFKTSTSSLCHTAVAPLPLDETPLDYTVIYKGALRQQSREHDSLISSSGMGILGKIVRNCHLGPPGSTSPNVGQQRVHVSMRSAHVLGTRLGSSALGAAPPRARRTTLVFKEEQNHVPTPNGRAYACFLPCTVYVSA
jgi:hypothetical protein